MDGVEEPVQSGVVLGGLRVAGGRDDADAAALAHEGEDARDDGVRGGEALAVVVEGDVAIEGDELEGPGADEGEDLSCVEDQAQVVEGGGDEAAGGDVAAGVLVDEGVAEGEGRKERADCGDEEF